MDLATVRADIKAWERAFKADHNRQPSIDDIKLVQNIADKYKLYKKLSKSQPSLLLSNPRPVLPSKPLSSNPFSPRKNSQKRPTTSPTNPFAGPSKPSPARLPSLDPFLDTKPASSSKFVPTSAISRARKRLRGESVSPSPTKEKRRRVVSPILPPFPNLAPSDVKLDDPPPATAAFVDNSPVKAPAGSKSFKLLFEETTPKSIPSATKIAKTRSTAPLPGLFGERSATGADDDPFTVDGVTRLTPSVRSSIKRSLSKMNLTDASADPITTESSLLPPSPTTASSSRPKYNAKGKGKITASRKKAKFAKGGDADEESDGDESDVPVNNVKLVDRRIRAPKEDDLDLDPIMGYSRRVSPRGFHSPLPNTDSEDMDGMGNVQVNLPDKLRRVLALGNTESQTRHSREEQVFSGLLYGRRTTHYDPVKGGEIWDVGEDTRGDGENGTRADTEGEDDWEGEPVPWEVGEL